MNLKRTTAIAVGVGALAAWLAGAATSTRAPALPIVTARPAIEGPSAALATEIARLHERLRPATTLRPAGRNLFTYHTRAAAPLAAPPAPKPALAELPAPVVAQPSLKLAGVAEDADAEGNPVRTAIISGEGQLFMVKEGEQLTARYRVTKISEDVVELLDLATQTPRRLALR